MKQEGWIQEKPECHFCKKIENIAKMCFRDPDSPKYKNPGTMST